MLCTLQSEGCIESVAQPSLGLVTDGVHVFTALCSSVYVQCVHGSNKMCIPTIVFVQCVHPYCKEHNFIIYKNKGNNRKEVCK